MARRDEWLERASRPGGTGDARPRSPVRRAVAAAVLGWLVLMTIWGIGRSGFPERAGWFLAAGLVAGAVTSLVLLWGAHRASRQASRSSSSPAPSD